MRVVLFLDHACNLRCNYCYIGPKFQRRMPWEIARRGIDLAFILVLGFIYLARVLPAAPATRPGPA